jgi:hypothetical protein
MQKKIQMTNRTKKLLLIVGVLTVTTILATIIHNINSPGRTIKPGISYSTATPPSLAVNVIRLDSGWGYQILIDGNVFIKQDRIPCISSAEQFASQDEALKCGELVISKIKANHIPAISIAELDSIGIQYKK